MKSKLYLDWILRFAFAVNQFLLFALHLEYFSLYTSLFNLLRLIINCFTIMVNMMIQYRPFVRKLFVWNCCLGVSIPKKEGENSLFIFQTSGLTNLNLLKIKSTCKKNSLIFLLILFANKMLSAGGILMRREAIPNNQLSYFGLSGTL